MAVCLAGLASADDKGPAPEQAPPGDVLIRVNVAESEQPAGVAFVSEELDTGTFELALINDLKDVQNQHAVVEGKYWIGLMCNAPGEALRSQLDLPENVGLVVEQVVDGGPAKKAGIMPHDVLIAATVSKEQAARSLTAVAELVAAVQAAETGTLKLEFLRKGRKQTLELVAAERPQPPQGQANFNIQWLAEPPIGLRWAGPMVLNLAPPALPEGTTVTFHPAEGAPQSVTVTTRDKTFEEKVESLDKLPPEIAAIVRGQLAVQQHVPARAGWIYRAAATEHPHIVVRTLPPSLPADVSVTTIHKGAEPPRTTVQKGEQSWEVNPKDLSNLPAELRPFVDAIVHQPVFPRPFTNVTALPPVLQPGVAPGAVPSAPGAPAPRITVAKPQALGAIRRMEVHQNPAPKGPQEALDRDERDIERQLKALTEQVEKLRQSVEKVQPRQ
jgi:hypothetical protein